MSIIALVHIEGLRTHQRNCDRQSPRRRDQVKKQHGGKDPYSMIVFTNHPHQYAAKDEKDPSIPSCRVTLMFQTSKLF